MAYSWVNQRLNDLENNIQRELQLLNDFNEVLAYETNPRRIAGYRKDIERQRKSIAEYEQEYAELKKELHNNQESSSQLKNIGHQLEQIESKVGRLLNGQAVIYKNLSQMQQNLLARYDESQQAIVAEIVQQLDDNQLILTQNLLEALNTNKLSESDIQEMVAILEERIPALPLSQQASINEVIKNPELNAKHKLKVGMTIIPFLVKYEGELELGTGFDLKSVLQQLKTKLRGN